MIAIIIILIYITTTTVALDQPTNTKLTRDEAVNAKIKQFQSISSFVQRFQQKLQGEDKIVESIFLSIGIAQRIHYAKQSLLFLIKVTK
jgi:hypothetical protein